MVLTPDRLAATVLEAAPDAMIVVDAGGIIRFANRRVTDLFGYSPEELISLNIERLMPDRLRRRHIGLRSEYMADTRVSPTGLGLYLYGLRRDGAEFPVEISLSPIEDDGEPLVAAAIRDASRMLLSVEGYQVTAVSSLAEALEASRAGVDLLVSDYHLSDGETGTQVIATLREARRTPLKAVLVTGDTSIAVRELPRDPNLRIASKPLQAEELLKLLQSLMGAGDPRLLTETPVFLETREHPSP